ncbi:MAG: serine dehydratase subunit alpha family protein [Hungatella hathewayi]|nr:serine dehydratase subunit alpha family protein [Hungatella hathewayi]
MHELTRLIREDMKPALGVTEPGAIAFAAATAREHLGGEVEHVYLRLNSGMFKNAFTCGIPGSDEVGNYHAAALGAVAADARKGLECLEGIKPEEERKAREMVESGRVSVDMSEISSRIFIEVKVAGGGSEATVTIRDSHMNVVEITENGEVVYSKEAGRDAEGKSGRSAEGESEQSAEYESGQCAKTEAEQSAEGEFGRPADKADETCLIHRYTLRQLYDYAHGVPVEEIAFIDKAFDMNRELLEEGLHSAKTTYGPYLLRKNGGKMISEDERLTASLLCNGAIEARVLGLSKPAMSITGSGAHGIIATMPLYGACMVNGYPKEALLRATALSYLVCMYIKEYSGKLSAFCGCAIAAGTGMACGLVFLRGGSVEMMEKTISNMASSITGMICDGGNQGCTMKGIVAVDAAYESVELAMNGIFISNVHGINGDTPEKTMENMGRIASPGMVGTEKTIVEILDEKRR